MNPRLLIIEDELPMRTALKDVLEAEGYRVLTAANGEAGLDRAMAEKPDLILLDLMMPKRDGYSVAPHYVAAPTRCPSSCSRPRARSKTGSKDSTSAPMITWSNPSAPRNCSRGSGLCSVACKNPQGAAHARPGRGAPGFHPATSLAREEATALNCQEFAVLRLLAEAAGEPVSRERFLDAVWGYTAFPTTRTVDMHIASLRAKVEKNAEQPRFIHTVHGVGYRLSLNDPDE